MTKLNETFQTELENVEFEVSYDFTKDIRENLSKKLKTADPKKAKTNRVSLVGTQASNSLMRKLLSDSRFSLTPSSL